MDRFVKVFILLMLFPMAHGTAQMIVAHRGASHDAPENTIAAFQLAWQQNADGIEGDFYLTSDDQIVCIHDATTKRTSAKDLQVNQSTLDDLRGVEVGRWKGPQWRGEPIPTFAEVFATVPPGKTFVIELKSKTEIVVPLRRELERLHHDAIDLLIISFDASTIQLCKEQMPNIKAHWLTSFKQNQISGRWTPSAMEIAATVKQCRADGVGMQGNRQWIDDAFIHSLREADCNEFHVWTIDDPEDARYFKKLGAFGITTNRPNLIRTSL